MMLFTAAVAAALELSPSSLSTGVYAYHTVLRFDLATNAHNAPQLVSAILAQLQLDEPDIVFTNSDARRIDNDNLPEDKPAFDTTFAVTTNRVILSLSHQLGPHLPPGQNRGLESASETSHLFRENP
jgi:hypothetical protein